MEEKIIIEQVSYDFKIIRTFTDENVKDTLGYIDYYQQYDDGKYNIINVRTWLVKDKVNKNNPVHVKETLKWIVDLFLNDKARMVQYIVPKESTAYYACDAFCEVMGGKRSEKIKYEMKNEQLQNEWTRIEFIITLSGFKEKKYEGSIEDIIKIILHKTNLLKREYKNKCMTGAKVTGISPPTTPDPTSLLRSAAVNAPPIKFG